MAAPRDRDQTEAMIDGIIERAHIEPRTEYYLAVTAADAAVGFVRLGLNGVEAAKLGYAIGADFWRRGYARDAVRVMLSFGFQTLGLHRISAAIGPQNIGSQRLVESLGFTHEGQIRDHVRDVNGWRDSLLYSVLAHEWETPEQSPGPADASQPPQLNGQCSWCGQQMPIPDRAQGGGRNKRFCSAACKQGHHRWQQSSGAAQPADVRDQTLQTQAHPHHGVPPRSPTEPSLTSNAPPPAGLTGTKTGSSQLR